jgi:hypothetical protein
MLPIKPGTTLRAHLSDKLHCDPMRITKKYAGASCIGKMTFTPSVARLDPEAVLECTEELGSLEEVFMRLASTEQGSYHSMISNGRNSSIGGFNYSGGSRKRGRYSTLADAKMGVRRGTTDGGGDFSHYEFNVFAASNLLCSFAKKMRESCEDSSVASASTGKETEDEEAGDRGSDVEKRVTRREHVSGDRDSAIRKSVRVKREDDVHMRGGEETGAHITDTENEEVTSSSADEGGVGSAVSEPLTDEEDDMMITPHVSTE